MVQPRVGAPSRVLENLFTQASRQSYRSQAPRFQSRITSVQANSLASSRPSYAHPVPAFLPFSQVRHASHATQGAANAHSESRPGRRLGAKKAAGEYVIPGNIIFRQRGTKWYPGENCGMGRDHTIYATEKGYVKFYRDPDRHPDKKYIGVAYNREDKLPTPKNAPSKRRLGLIAVPRRDMSSETELGTIEIDANDKPTKVNVVASGSRHPRLRPGYMYREGNWEIGRAADDVKFQVKEWRRNDRWTAWKKKLDKIKRIAAMKELKNRRKSAKSSKSSKKKK